MKRTPRLLVAIGVAALSAGVAGPLSVHAADGDTDSVVFAGRIHTAVPVPLVGGPPAGIPYVYAQIACDIVASSDAAVTDPLPCVLGAPGNYFNLACGTGVAMGVANLAEADGPDIFNYEIELAGGVGVILGGATGVVTIVPDPTAGVIPPVGTCGSDFLISGTAVTN
jgi:hypothetical protein